MNTYKYVTREGNSYTIDAYELPFFYTNGYTLVSITKMTHEQEAAAVLRLINSVKLSIT